MNRAQITWCPFLAGRALNGNSFRDAVTDALDARDAAERQLREILTLESSLRKQEQEQIVSQLEADVLSSIKGQVSLAQIFPMTVTKLLFQHNTHSLASHVIGGDHPEQVLGRFEGACRQGVEYDPKFLKLHFILLYIGVRVSYSSHAYVSNHQSNIDNG